MSVSNIILSLKKIKTKYSLTDEEKKVIDAVVEHMEEENLELSDSSLERLKKAKKETELISHEEFW